MGFYVFPKHQTHSFLTRYSRMHTKKTRETETQPLIETQEHNLVRGWKNSSVHTAGLALYASAAGAAALADASEWQQESVKESAWETSAGAERGEEEAAKRGEKRGKRGKRELHSVCSGLIRVIISLSLPGPSPELAYTGAGTNTHAWYVQIHIPVYAEWRWREKAEKQRRDCRLRTFNWVGEENSPQSTYLQVSPESARRTLLPAF